MTFICIAGVALCGTVCIVILIVTLFRHWCRCNANWRGWKHMMAFIKQYGTRLIQLDPSLTVDQVVQFWLSYGYDSWLWHTRWSQSQTDCHRLWKSCGSWFRNLLGLQASDSINGLSGAELSKLIYRDNVTVKHAPRKRLAEEMAHKSFDAQDIEATEDSKKSSKPGLGGPLTRALKNYLISASWPDRAALYLYNVFFF